MLRHGARHGTLHYHGPGKAQHWLPLSCCAAEMRRKTTLGASPHLPSSPCTTALPALSCLSASGSFISRLEVQIAPLSRQLPPSLATHAGISTWPYTAGTKRLATWLPCKIPLDGRGVVGEDLCPGIRGHLCSHWQRTPKIWLLPGACREIEAPGFLLVLSANERMLGLRLLSFMFA